MHTLEKEIFYSQNISKTYLKIWRIMPLNSLLQLCHFKAKVVFVQVFLQTQKSRGLLGMYSFVPITKLEWPKINAIYVDFYF